MVSVNYKRFNTFYNYELINTLAESDASISISLYGSQHITVTYSHMG